MSYRKSKGLLQAKVNHFINNKNDTDSLVDLISEFKVAIEQNSSLIPYLLAIEAIFVDLLKCRTMTIRMESMKIPTKSDVIYKEFLQLRLQEIFKLCLDILGRSDKIPEAQQSISTLLKLIANEGQYPLNECETTSAQNFFPMNELSMIISKLLLINSNSMKHLLIKLSEYTDYEDVRYYMWKILLKAIVPHTQNNFNGPFIQNFLELMNVLIVLPADEEEERKFLCKEVKLSGQILRRNVNKAVQNVLQWDHTEVTQRQFLLLILEKILVHLEKPQLLADYLMDCLDMGGNVSLIALQLIFILIHKYNMSYPLIYKKLYAMFEPECFHMKFKARLFYLVDIFLSSSYLPETIVAAFAKRLARLALIASPQDITIILHFIANLIIRHPGLKRLLISQHVNQEKEMSEDFYMMEESDPNASRALESSLWEIQLLRHHLLPSISHLSKTIMTHSLSQEFNIGELLEMNENDIFDREIATKSKEYALVFERPLADAFKNNQLHTSAMNKYWNF